jgi:hypothetical protein
VRELAVIIPLVLVIVWIGLYPRPFLRRMETSTKAIMEQVMPVAKLQAAQSPGLARSEAATALRPAAAEEHGRPQWRVAPAPRRESPAALPETGG